MHIRIIRTPSGEAPVEIREAWVGLVMPLYPGDTGLHRFAAQGVLTGPRSWLGKVFARLSGRYRLVEGYRVEAVAAVELLAQKSDSAAIWWRTHRPDLLVSGKALVFHSTACQQVEGAQSASVRLPSEQTDPEGPYTSDLS